MKQPSDYMKHVKRKKVSWEDKLRSKGITPWSEMEAELKSI